MIHLSLIICFLSVFLHDSLAEAMGASPFSPAMAGVISLVPFACLIVYTHLALRGLGRAIDRTGSWAAVNRAELLVRRSRLAAVGLHLVNVWLIGWVEAVRAITSDLVLIDELVILAPVLLAWTCGWWSIEPIERRIREAALIRDLDSGRPVYPIVTRWQFILSNLRYHVLLLLVPMCMLLAWAETVDRFAPRYLGSVSDPITGRTRLDPDMQGYATLIQLAGVGFIFFLMPLGLRLVWDTVPLGPGRLRDALQALCTRARVRIGNLLVWRTHGLMLNGAVIGLFWPLRYILLTDALLDALSHEQVEAVAAHEVGHIRRRHLLWLAATMITVIAASGMVLGAIQTALVLTAPQVAASPAAEALLALVSLGLALTILGYVSRRFEWQADAYAVAVISRQSTPEGTLRPSRIVTTEAVLALHNALTTVAHASGLPLRKFTWRHGSIWTRQKRLEALVGRPINRLPIDRDVRWLKAAIASTAAVTLMVLLGAVALGSLLQQASPPP